MDLLFCIVIVFTVTFAIFGVVDVFRQINRLPDEKEEGAGD